MRLEEQVTSLELAKKLKELGVPQESLYYWYTSEFGEPHIEHKPSNNVRDWESVSAFTVAELGEMLPQFHTSTSKNMHTGEKYLCEFWKDGSRQHYTWATTEADARAKLLIYLFEHNLM